MRLYNVVIVILSLIILFFVNPVTSLAERSSWGKQSSGCCIRYIFLKALYSQRWKTWLLHSFIHGLMLQNMAGLSDEYSLELKIPKIFFWMPLKLTYLGRKHCCFVLALAYKSKKHPKLQYLPFYEAFLISFSHAGATHNVKKNSNQYYFCFLSLIILFF